MKTMYGYLLNNNTYTVGKVLCHNSINEIGRWMGTKDLIMPRMWAGIIPVMAIVLRSRNNLEVSAYNWKGEPTNRGPLLIFGRTEDDWVRSLTLEECRKLDDMVEIVCVPQTNEPNPPHYVLRGLNTKIEIE